MSGDIMGHQEVEVGPSGEADVTQTAGNYMNSWQARLTENAVVYGLGVLVGVGSGAGGLYTAYLFSQEGDVLKAVGVGIASLAALVLGLFAGKKAVDNLRQLGASEHHG